MKQFKQIFGSVVLLSLVAAWSTTLVAQTESKAPAPKWLRGEGESLKIRIRGKLLRDDKQPVENASMDVRMTSVYGRNTTNTILSNLDGDSYEVWLPVGTMKCKRVTFSVTAKSVGAQTMFFRDQLRQMAVDGFDIELKPLRTINITAVDLDGIAVTDATVVMKVHPSGTVRGKTDANGVASFDLPEDAKNLSLDAWKESATVRLLGGIGILLEPLGDKHKVTMFPCETRKIVLLDENKIPVARVPLKFVFVVPEPNRTVLTTPDDVKMQTDDKGELTLKWLPDVDGVLAAHDLFDKRWATDYDPDIDMTAPTLTFRAVRRPLEKISGRISSVNQGKSGLGGFAIELIGPDVAGSFPHSNIAFTDAKGNFSVDVIRDKKYGYWVDDEAWTSATVERILASTNADQMKPVTLRISQNYPVRISLIDASDKTPLVGAQVDLRTPYLHNGRGLGFSCGRKLRRTTDQSGVIEAVVAPGKLELRASLGDWRSGKTVTVIPRKLNKFTIDKTTVPVKFTGQLKTWDASEIDFQSCEILVGGLTSREHLTLAADEDGMFNFEIEAKRFDILVYSADRALSGSATLEAPKQPLEIELYPTHNYTGQVLYSTGEPIADHSVRAWFYDSSEGATRLRVTHKMIDSKTDADGNFTFENLPSKTKINISTRQHTARRNTTYLNLEEKLVFQPEDLPRPPKVTTFSPQDKRHLNEIAPKYKRLRSDCQLAGYHLLVTVSDMSDFELQQRLESSIVGNSIGWMQMSLETSQLNRKINRKLAKFKKWDAPAGSALICVYNASGKLLDRKTLASAAPDFADSIKNLMNHNAPTKPDAVDKWKAAFKLAGEDNRRVFVMIGDLKQKSGRYLRRWIHEAEETLEKDFILLNLDTSLDLRVDEVIAVLRDVELELPSIAIFDTDQRVVTYGEALDFATERVRTRETLQRVLEQGCQKIKGDEIKRIVSQSAALGGG